MKKLLAGLTYPILACMGPMTMEDIWNIIPTNPPVSMVDITGAELILMLEENLENTFAKNPYE